MADARSCRFLKGCTDHRGSSVSLHVQIPCLLRQGLQDVSEIDLEASLAVTCSIHEGWTIQKRSSAVIWSSQSHAVLQPQSKQNTPKKSMAQEHLDPYLHSDQPKKPQTCACNQM